MSQTWFGWGCGRALCADKLAKHVCSVSMVKSLAHAGCKRAVPKRSFATRTGDVELLRARLSGQCGCRRACFTTLRSSEIFPKLVSWRTSFAELHKIDQDRFVTLLQRVQQ